jgi:GNAT superfamily N-acetyltransferase
VNNLIYDGKSCLMGPGEDQTHRFLFYRKEFWMEIPYEMSKLDSPAWEEIGGALTAYNAQQAGDDGAKTLCYVMKDSEGAILGGAIGAVYWDWLSLDLMWVREDLRGQAIGSRLIEKIEAAARQQGAKHAHLDTFSFQAPGFYDKHGYAVFGELADFPAGFQRFYMTKEL